MMRSFLLLCITNVESPMASNIPSISLYSFALLPPPSISDHRAWQPGTVTWARH